MREPTGSFRVQLVDPVNKKPFQEHIKGGKRYFEAEPNAEYCIRVERIRRNRNGTEGAEYGRVYVTNEVDGLDLGYYSTMDLGNNQNNPTAEGDTLLNGSFAIEAGSQTRKALRFAVPQIRPNGTHQGGGNMVGTVSVRFFEAIEVGIRESQNFMPPVPPCEIGASVIGASKALRSGIGSWSQTEQCAARYMHYRPGEHLETITIYYGTALGLIYAGILPKPPLWAYARLESPLTEPMDPRLANIIPTRVPIDAVVANGVTLSQATEWELFDLTHL